MAAAATAAEPREGQSASILAASRSSSAGSGAHPGIVATRASPLLAFLPSRRLAVSPSSVTATRGAWQTAGDPYTGRGGPDSTVRGGTAPGPTPGPPRR